MFNYLQLAGFPKSSSTFVFYILDIEDVVLVNKPAPTRVLTVAEYLNA